MLYFNKLAVLALSALATTVSAIPLLEERSGKPTGGPASMTLTIYNGPYDCVSASTPPPTDGTAGTNTTLTLSETQCSVIAIPYGAALTAKLTATPKIGTVGCYVQMYTGQGCGNVVTNDYHGFPFSGITVGSTMGCGGPPDVAYGAVEIFCA